MNDLPNIAFFSSPISQQSQTVEGGVSLERFLELLCPLVVTPCVIVHTDIM